MMAAAPIQQNGTHTGVPIDLDPPDSRKRPLEAPPEAGSTKRTNTGEDGQYFLKVLIPSYAAGSIIGKGGQTIVQLQKETGATIKLSKSKDFYPGSLSLIENLDVDEKELYSKKILYEMIAEDQDSRSSMQSAPAVCNNHTVIT
ncbi:hypothetical protein Q9966_014753 [Columba livia]|nr:hypothetical protein Q9966_014753 [Columba livia]